MRRKIRSVPVAGGLLEVCVRRYRGLRDARLRKQRELRNTYVDFRNRHDTRASNITRKNNRRAYDRVYADDRLLDEYLAPERVAFYEEVAELCARWNPRSVIDVGCGSGNLLRALVDKTSPRRVVGVDHATAGIERARQLLPSGEFEARDLTDLELDETFELVLCTEVLEHLADPGAAMRVLTRLCAETGVIVVTVPDGSQDTWEGHRNFWNEVELHEFMQDYGSASVSRMRRAGTSLFAVVKPLPTGQELAKDQTTLPFGV
jgi:2-polyprenyl-3-methyl-5-hydroxy-6-metoxy-1,4-benzoquinol methylase